MGAPIETWKKEDFKELYSDNGIIIIIIELETAFNVEIEDAEAAGLMKLKNRKASGWTSKMYC